VPGYGAMQLVKMQDGISREMKDNLYIKEVDEQLLSILPDWMRNIMRDHNLSINIPASLALNKTRNDVMQKETIYHDVVQPMLVKLIVDYIIQ
jgi:hypothetical protein